MNPRLGQLNPNWHEALGSSRVVTQLTVAVVPPTLDAAALEHGAGVIITRSDDRRGANAGNIDRRGTIRCAVVA